MKSLVVGGLIVAALVVAYFVMRPRASTDIAPAAVSRTVASATREQAPPARVTAAPKDVRAEFQSLQLCAYASRELAVTNYLSNCAEYEGRPEFQELYAQCLNGWMNVPSRKAAAEAALKDSGCGDLTDVDARYFSATAQAARAGDAEAQMCFLQGSFGDMDLEEYSRVAPHYVDAALRRGDWRIVQLMTRSSFHPGVEPMRRIPDIGKPETIYKMKKLLRLGASGSYATSLDRDLEAMIHPDLVPEAALSADVIRRGDAWAQQTFNEYFAGVAGLSERPTICGPEPVDMGRLPGPATR